MLLGWYATYPKKYKRKIRFFTIDYSTINPIFTIVSFAVLGWYIASGNEKTQLVRLINIFVYGPYLIFLGLQNMYVFTEFEKLFLLFFGAIAILYNTRNYLHR